LRGGWLHTGDLGSFDEAGFLTLRDRSKDMIISGGSNIYPREIEEVLLRHPDLVEASVVGRPHHEWGEEVVAFVVARPGAAVAAEALDRPVPGPHRPLQAPASLRFVDALPKNNYGKVLKTELRRLWPSRNAKHPQCFYRRWCDVYGRAGMPLKICWSARPNRRRLRPAGAGVNLARASRAYLPAPMCYRRRTSRPPVQLVLGSARQPG